MTDRGDLVARLRGVPLYEGHGEESSLPEAAADQIERDGREIERLREALKECELEIDGYIRQEYPFDHPVQERLRKRDFAANPARAALNPEGGA
ncbi:hypothetical protein [Pontibaca methylaminivorans]|uniref:Uncharacterized protein n=1 Tax=Pontibaca methylaminivorans TaxID=515897 RepID=A0A1R3W954_9RHOB|nr:hypothetical protein [Pontibaca methylaminivorans]SIT74554.1 hypothetical protein SAMN05421849_0177 [Pontibaca methylaminivorans]